MKKEPQGNAFTVILLAGAIAGVLDFTAACVTSYLKLGIKPLQVMQYIASAVYGAAAYAKGWTSASVGLLMHFSIAFLIALFYCAFLLSPVSYIGPTEKISGVERRYIGARGLAVSKPGGHAAKQHPAATI